MAVLMSARGPSWLLLAAAIPFLLMFAIRPVRSAPVYEDEQHHQLESYNDDTGCYYNYQHYGEGDRIITNEPCLNCTCHNRMLMCYLRVCPFTKAIGSDCTVEKKADQCCPVITCPEVPVQLLSHQPSSTTMRPQASTAVGHRDTYGCTIDSEFFADGAQIPSEHNKPCELCYCIRNHTACVMQECTLNVEGCRPIYQDNVCCPVRYECDYPEDPTTIEPGTGGGLILTTTTTMSPNLGCRYNDDEYADGALIHMDDKPCEHCYCMRGDIVCAVQECGTPLEKEGHNCTALPPQPGKCCPEMYQCDTGIEYVTDASFRMNRKQYGNTYDDSLNEPLDDTPVAAAITPGKEPGNDENLDEPLSDTIEQNFGEPQISNVDHAVEPNKENKPVQQADDQHVSMGGVALDAGDDDETSSIEQVSTNDENSQNSSEANDKEQENQTELNLSTTEINHHNENNFDNAPAFDENETNVVVNEDGENNQEEDSTSQHTNHEQTTDSPQDSDTINGQPDKEQNLLADDAHPGTEQKPETSSESADLDASAAVTISSENYESVESHTEKDVAQVVESHTEKDVTGLVESHTEKDVTDVVESHTEKDVTETEVVEPQKPSTDETIPESDHSQNHDAVLNVEAVVAETENLGNTDESAEIPDSLVVNTETSVSYETAKPDISATHTEGESEQDHNKPNKDTEPIIVHDGQDLNNDIDNISSDAGVNEDEENDPSYVTIHGEIDSSRPTSKPEVVEHNTENVVSEVETSSKPESTENPLDAENNNQEISTENSENESELEHDSPQHTDSFSGMEVMHEEHKPVQKPEADNLITDNIPMNENHESNLQGSIQDITSNEENNNNAQSSTHIPNTETQKPEVSGAINPENVTGDENDNLPDLPDKPDYETPSISTEIPEMIEIEDAEIHPVSEQHNEETDQIDITTENSTVGSPDHSGFDPQNVLSGPIQDGNDVSLPEVQHVDHDNTAETENASTYPSEEQSTDNNGLIENVAQEETENNAGNSSGTTMQSENESADVDHDSAGDIFTNESGTSHDPSNNDDNFEKPTNDAQESDDVENADSSESLTKPTEPTNIVDDSTQSLVENEPVTGTNLLPEQDLEPTKEVVIDTMNENVVPSNEESSKPEQDASITNIENDISSVQHEVTTDSTDYEVTDHDHGSNDSKPELDEQFVMPTHDKPENIPLSENNDELNIHEIDSEAGNAVLEGAQNEETHNDDNTTEEVVTDTATFAEDIVQDTMSQHISGDNILADKESVYPNIENSNQNVESGVLEESEVTKVPETQTVEAQNIDNQQPGAQAGLTTESSNNENINTADIEPEIIQDAEESDSNEGSDAQTQEPPVNAGEEIIEIGTKRPSENDATTEIDNQHLADDKYNEPSLVIPHSTDSPANHTNEVSPDNSAENNNDESNVQESTEVTDSNLLVQSSENPINEFSETKDKEPNTQQDIAISSATPSTEILVSSTESESNVQNNIYTTNKPDNQDSNEKPVGEVSVTPEKDQSTEVSSSETSLQNTDIISNGDKDVQTDDQQQHAQENVPTKDEPSTTDHKETSSSSSVPSSDTILENGIYDDEQGINLDESETPLSGISAIHDVQEPNKEVHGEENDQHMSVVEHITPHPIPVESDSLMHEFESGSNKPDTSVENSNPINDHLSGGVALDAGEDTDSSQGENVENTTDKESAVTGMPSDSGHPEEVPVKDEKPVWTDAETVNDSHLHSSSTEVNIPIDEILNAVSEHDKPNNQENAQGDTNSQDSELEKPTQDESINVGMENNEHVDILSDNKPTQENDNDASSENSANDGEVHEDSLSEKPTQQVTAQEEIIGQVPVHQKPIVLDPSHVQSSHEENENQQTINQETESQDTVQGDLETQSPAQEVSVTQQIENQDPVTQESATQETATDDSINTEHAPEKPADHEPTSQEFAGHETTQNEPIQHESENNKPLQNEPTENDNVQQEPTEQKPAEQELSEPEHIQNELVQHDIDNHEPTLHEPQGNEKPEPTISEPAENKPVQNIPEETDSIEHELVQQKPIETEPAQHEPAQHKPAQHEPAQHEPTQHEPAQHEPAQHEPALHEPAQHEPAQHEHVQHEPAQHEPAELEPTQHESAELELTQHEPAEHEPAQHEPVQHETAQHDSAQQEPADHETAEHDSAQHEPAEHETTEHELAEHGTAVPETAEHEAAEPETAEHETAEHETAEPETAEHETTEHETAVPEIAQHEPPQNEAAQHEPVQQETEQNEPAEHESSQHVPAEHEPAQHKPAEHELTQLKPAQHEPALHEPTQQEPAQNKPAQTEHAQHEPAQHEPAQQGSDVLKPSQHEPAQHEPAQHEPAQHEPAQHEHGQQGSDIVKPVESDSATDVVPEIEVSEHVFSQTKPAEPASAQHKPLEFESVQPAPEEAAQHNDEQDEAIHPVHQKPVHDFQQHIPSISDIHISATHPAMQDAEETNPDHFTEDIHLQNGQQSPVFSEEHSHVKPGFSPEVFENNDNVGTETSTTLPESEIASVEGSSTSTESAIEEEKHPEGKPGTDVSDSSSEEVTESGDFDNNEEAPATDIPALTLMDGGCNVDGEVFASGSTIKVANPCQESCICDKGIVHCTLRPCPSPPSNNPNCMPMYRDGSCCPIYTCVDEYGQVVTTDNNVLPESQETPQPQVEVNTGTSILGDENTKPELDITATTSQSDKETIKPDVDAPTSISNFEEVNSKPESNDSTPSSVSEDANEELHVEVTTSISHVNDENSSSNVDATTESSHAEEEITKPNNEVVTTTTLQTEYENYHPEHDILPSVEIENAPSEHLTHDDKETSVTSSDKDTPTEEVQDHAKPVSPFIVEPVVAEEDNLEVPTTTGPTAHDDESSASHGDSNQENEIGMNSESTVPIHDSNNIPTVAEDNVFKPVDTSAVPVTSFVPETTTVITDDSHDSEMSVPEENDNNETATVHNVQAVPDNSETTEITSDENVSEHSPIGQSEVQEDENSSTEKDNSLEHSSEIDNQSLNIPVSQTEILTKPDSSLPVNTLDDSTQGIENIHPDIEESHPAHDDDNKPDHSTVNDNESQVPLFETSTENSGEQAISEDIDNHTDSSLSSVTPEESNDSSVQSVSVHDDVNSEQGFDDNSESGVTDSSSTEADTSSIGVANDDENESQNESESNAKPTEQVSNDVQPIVHTESPETGLSDVPENLSTLSPVSSEHEIVEQVDSVSQDPMESADKETHKEPEDSNAEKPLEHEAGVALNADDEEDSKPFNPQSEQETQKPIHHDDEAEHKPAMPHYPDPVLPDMDEDDESMFGGFPDQAPEPGSEFMPPMPSYEDDDHQAAFGPGTCRYGGKVYVSAQQIPRDDPCDFCFCFRSDIICLQQSCPPPIKGCHEEAIDGFCCPRYECPVPMGLMNATTTTTTTTTLPPDLISSYVYGRRASSGCLVQGALYGIGEEITTASGPCLECRCGGDSKMKCEPKACSPQPLLRKMIEAVSLRR